MGCLASRPSAAPALDEKRTLLDAYAADKPSHTPVDTTSRLAALRACMDEAGVQAYIVPSEDAHASEYAAECDQRLAYVSGFTGSSGTVVIFGDSAHLFTDGRYHIQAAQQLDMHWTLHKVGEPGVQEWPAWLASNLDGAQAGVDATVISYTLATKVASMLAECGSGVTYTANLVDQVWRDRPKPSRAPVYVHEMKYAGVSSESKICDVRTWMQSKKENNAYVLSSLDQVAWLLNVRGASVPCNPVFPSYMIVTPDQAALFVDEALLLGETCAYLAAIPVSVHAYGDVFDWIAALSSAGTRFYFDEKASAALVRAAEQSFVLLPPDNPLAMAKARKNPTELNGMRNAYLRDGAAWARWAAWLEEQIVVHGKHIDERTAADAFATIRAQDPLYAGMQAYDAISATGANAALPHYETPRDGAPIINRMSPYLNDSGAQYHDGTIDTTRTVHFGTPTSQQKRAFTRVLQGHIALASARFPEGTTGVQLDMLARAPLFRDGYNYMHGTGHGVGSFLNVHEGPCAFSAKSSVPLQEGITLSDEPGFYEEGQFGIRIESILAVQSCETYRDFGRFYEFELLTRVPIQRKMIDFAMLSPVEVQWLQWHNAMVRDAVLPLVRKDPRAANWLRRQ
ncbi:Xaa-Pro aminopeptidase [Malassezia vespertilionis]|uniref:Fra1p n=1 Tax=Malassezia vespertilionis TaxID=2020962 RepID=A0A2N1JCG5_9BASI|nr:Xaa-Pro aminopeptidase [Malassezia vespertilionis]PKI84223.1 hypothetical protein MVES_001543 [Malassezia vespertilionis]WFD06296.1 Xaa-Pro aminopeptidase [Malassezia vespertilionis]